MSSSNNVFPEPHFAFELSKDTLDETKSKFSSYLNAGMSCSLLMGIYTLIYIGTMYLYISRRFHHRFRILASVTALWLCNVAQFGVEWFCTIWQFSTEGEGHKSSVMQLELEVIANVLALISIVLTDAILIWRCFVLWDHSWRIVFGPVFLIVAETGLLLAQIIRRAMLSSISWTSEPALLDKFDIISAAGFIVAAATTLLTTMLIAYRIFSILEHQIASSRMFKRVMDIVVQSGAVYSVTLLVYGVAALTGVTLVQGHDLTYWAQSAVFDISGISTTIMVARVALLTDNTPTPKDDISDIHFRSSSSSHTEVRQILNITQNISHTSMV